MLPDAQHFMRPGIIEFTWGHPDLALFPAEELARAATLALSRDDRAELCYGAVQGPGSLIRQLCAWLGRREGRAIPQEQIFIAGGLSQGLDLLCTLTTRPGDAILVDSPTYHLALRVFRDHGLELIPVAGDADGLRPDTLVDALARLRREHRSARFLYLVPNFGNPTGATIPLARRQAIAALAQEAGLTILEDDVYRHLWFDAPPPPPLSDLAPDHVIRLGSFSKLLAPGLRVGWLIAPPAVVRRCAGSGLLDSGGGASHFAAHVVAAFMELGGFDAHVEMLRAAYRARRDILCDAAGAASSRWLPVAGARRRLLRLGAAAGGRGCRGAAAPRRGGRGVLRARDAFLRGWWRRVLHPTGIHAAVAGGDGGGCAAVGRRVGKVRECNS